MTQLAGPLTDLLLYRTRTAGGIPFSTPFARSILSLSQSLIQSHFKRLLKTVNFTLIPLKPVYDTSIEFTDLIEITGMEYSSTDISRCKDWKELSRFSSTWMETHNTTRPYLFAQIGTRFLAITPTQSIARTLQVTYTYIPAELIDDNTPVELPDEDISFALDLAEIVLLMASARGARLQDVTAKVKQFIQRIGLSQESIVEERDI